MLFIVLSAYWKPESDGPKVVESVSEKILSLCAKKNCQRQFRFNVLVYVFTSHYKRRSRVLAS